MSELEPVRVGECLCPGTPHADGDFVYLRPKLGLAAGLAVQKLVLDANQAGTSALATADMVGVLAEGYLLNGVQSWNLMNGKAIPVNPQTIREHLLTDFERGNPVAERANELYLRPVIAPLAKRALESSLITASRGLTSAPGDGAPKRRKRSKPSSTSITPTDATATTSP